MIELKAYSVVASSEAHNYINGEINLAFEAYDADEVDALLTDKNKELEELKQKLHDAEMRADLAEAAETERKIDYDKLNAENRRLKKMMPKYKQFIEDEDYRKKLVDEYAGYVYEWAGHRYVATPYMNVFIKGILRTLYKALANWAKSERYTEATWHGDEDREELWAKVQDKCLKKAEEYR